MESLSWHKDGKRSMIKMVHLEIIKIHSLYNCKIELYFIIKTDITFLPTDILKIITNI